jgi:molybdopterin/thiamine biosynthesis adenylyltransferase
MREDVATDSILIVGVGGLGVPALWSLARSGARRLTLVDPDPVELSNLARQVIFRDRDIGMPKVDAAARWLGERFPDIKVEPHAVALDASNAARLVAAHDFVIDATDSPAAKFLINDTCIAARTPFVYGGVVGMTGQAMTVIPAETACIRCVFETPPDDEEIQSCREAGIVGPVAGAIGEMQAGEAMRALRAQKPLLSGKILTYDASSSSRVRITGVSPRPGCGCGASKLEHHESDSQGK